MIKEQKILEMMEEVLDRDPLLYGAIHYPIGSYYDLSGAPYTEIKATEPETPELAYFYW